MKNTLLPLLFLISFAIVNAQETTNFTFNHLALSVKNIDESATFITKFWAYKKSPIKPK